MKRLFRATASPGGMSTAALAPMVDVLTLVLVALLRTWSTDPPLQVSEEGFELPVSREEAPLGRGVTIDIGDNGLYVDGWRAGSATFWRDRDEVLVRDVYEVLQGRGETRALIRADRDAPWSLVGKIMFTAQQAGYTEVELVAMSRASL